MVVDRSVKIFGPPSLSPASRGPRRRGLRSQGDRQLGLLLALQLRHGRVDGTVPGPLHAQAGGQALNRVGKRSGPHPAPIHKHSRVGGHGRHRKPGLRRHRPVPVLSSQPLRAAESFTEPSSLLETEPPQLAIRRGLVSLPHESHSPTFHRGSVSRDAPGPGRPTRRQTSVRGVGWER